MEIPLGDDDEEEPAMTEGMTIGEIMKRQKAKEVPHILSNDIVAHGLENSVSFNFMGIQYLQKLEDCYKSYNYIMLPEDSCLFTCLFLTCIMY